MTGYRPQVREYLAYVARANADGCGIDPKHHPTEAGACRLISHGSDPAKAKAIREAFRDVVAERTTAATRTAERGDAA